MPITAKDIARELKLSQPTVSRILSGDLRHRASDETRRRVLETAERLGYHPNAVARSLRQGRTNVIGIHTSYKYDARNPFLGAIVGGLQRACGDYDLDLILHNALHGSRAETMYGKLRDGRIDGLILHSSGNAPLVDVLRRSALPVVAVADPLPGLPTVTCNDADGMKQLIDLLWERGHRNFAFLAPRIWLPSVERRQQAFEAELKRRKVPSARRQVISIELEEAAPSLDELQKMAPVAACCWNDRTAYNLLRACGAQGVRVPDQLAVAGFDGFRDDLLPARQLLTVGCPWPDVAAKALEVLVGLIENRDGRNANSAPTEIILPVALLDGDTA